ncbi:MAG: 50S ribosomal protein L22 [Acidimicrobiia bacterium]
MTATAAPRETRAVLRYYRSSASKARPVLDLIRGKSVAEARAILSLSTRGVAVPILKLLNSAVANAEHNDQMPADELFVGTAMADEGPTMRRFRARARGRGSRIRKRTCHIMIAVQRYSDAQIERQAKAEATTGGASRSRRVAQSRAAAGAPATEDQATTDEPGASSVPSTDGVVDDASAEAGEDDVPKVEDETATADASEPAETDDETKDA